MSLSRTSTQSIRFLLLLICAAALLGQGENEPYFALSSFRTFQPGGTPTIAVSAWNIDALEFRVYRVSDPVRFFQQLEDPHQFGGNVPRPPRDRSVLENIRMWKRSLKANIRRSLRAQFTDSPSSHFEKFLPHAQPVNATNLNTTKEIQYADVPVLNPQQLTLSFVKHVSGKTRWATENVDVPVRDKGIYLVEAVRKDLRAYTILMVSDLVLLTKNGSSRKIVQSHEIARMPISRLDCQLMPFHAGFCSIQLSICETASRAYRSSRVRTNAFARRGRC